MTTYLGIDVSKWEDSNVTPQGFNWVKAKQSGATFAFIKAGQANFQDEDFAYNWRESKSAGIPRGAYWYLDNRYDALAQANMFMNIMAGQADRGELPQVVDFEDRQLPKPAPSVAQTRLKAMLGTIQRVDGRVPIIYTAPAYWLEFGSSIIDWRTYPLWIANYGVTEPTVPVPWQGWAFWQYTPNGNGLLYGAESKSIDLNYYQFGHGFDSVITGTTPPVELTDKEKLDRLWAAHPELH